EIFIVISNSAFQDLSRSQSRFVIEQAIEARRSGNARDAEWTLKQHLLKQPDDMRVLAYLGDFLAEQGRDLEAGLAYKRALGYAPNADNVRLALAYLLQRQKQ